MNTQYLNLKYFYILHLWECCFQYNCLQEDTDIAEGIISTKFKSDLSS